MVTERDLSFVDEAPVRAVASRVVPASPERVWAVLADHRRWPEWFGPSLRSAEPTSQPEWGVDSTRRVKVRGGLTVDERFIAWDEPELWAFTATAISPGVFEELVEEVRLAPAGDGTSVTYTMALTPSVALRPVAGLLRKGLTRSLEGALKGLAAQVAQA